MVTNITTTTKIIINKSKSNIKQINYDNIKKYYESKVN